MKVSRRVAGIAALVIAATAATAALGFGTFRKPDSYDVSEEVYGLAVGDVNRDGLGDVVAALDQTPNGGVAVFKSRRSGALRDPDTVPAENFTEGIALGRFDPGRTLDIAAVNYGAENVTILHGKPAGGFSDEGNVGAGPGSWIVRAGDLDRDGKLDLVTGNYSSDGSDAVSVMLGNAAGTFETATDFPVANNGIVGVAIGRMNGDRRPDVVVVDQDGVLAVLPAKADGSLGAAKTRDYTDGDVGYQSVAIADYNRDGKLDAAVQASDEGVSGADVVRIFRGRGNGEFRAPLRRRLPSGYLNGIAAGDVNGDHRADVVVNNGASNDDGNYEVWVLRGRGSGRLRAPRRYPISTESPFTVALARVGADRGRDIVVGTDNTVEVLRNKR